VFVYNQTSKSESKFETPTFLISSSSYPYTDKPSAPLDLSISDITSTTCIFHWQPPKDNGGSDIIQYVVEKREANRRSWNKVATSATLELTIPNLTKNTQYLFCVAAENDVGTGEFAEMTEPITAKETFSMCLMDLFFIFTNTQILT